VRAVRAIVERTFPQADAAALATAIWALVHASPSCTSTAS
jgi:hypothetical protein